VAVTASKEEAVVAPVKAGPEPVGRVGTIQRAITLFVVAAPFVVGTIAVQALPVRPPQAHDIVLFVLLYAFGAIGITMGFHRLFTHQGGQPNAFLKWFLGIGGSLAFQGTVEGWVATHRCHHAYSDQPGDPHSPYALMDPDSPVSLRVTFRGIVRSHFGWLFTTVGAPIDRWAPDIKADPILGWISRHYLIIAIGSFALPFGVGYAFTGTLGGAFWCLAWAGALRVGMLHHVTWSINSICHCFGKRPFASGDRASNVWWLAIPSLGESWHNGHHAYPACARHGILPGQIDLTARAIRLCEKAGWVTSVRWPTERMIKKATAVGERRSRSPRGA
jgi:stearoyl-CoA desaturase (Delta-9 desaturase)